MKKNLFVFVLAIATFAANAQVKTPENNNDGNELYDKAQSQKPRKQIFKTAPFSLFSTNLTLGYERAIKARQSVDVSTKIIGIGYDLSELKPRGLAVSGGYRFYFDPLLAIRGSRFSNNFGGIYVQPTLAVSAFSRQVNLNSWQSSPTISRKTFSGAALMLSVGRQLVASNIFAVDVTAGLGYNLTYKKPTDNDDFFDIADSFYSHIGSKYSPMAFQASIKVGFLK